MPRSPSFEPHFVAATLALTALALPACESSPKGGPSSAATAPSSPPSANVASTAPPVREAPAAPAPAELTTRCKVTPTPAEPAAGKPFELRFEVSDAKSAAPVKEFDRVHDKLMHLIVVSKDLSTFLHIHPEQKDDGSFVISATLPKAGPYKLYTDYTPKGRKQEVPSWEFNVSGSGALSSTASLTPDEPKDGWVVKTALAHDEGKKPAKDAAQYQIAAMAMPAEPKAGAPAMLHFQVRDREGKPVRDLEPYLGAMGHAVVLSADTTHFLHSHPMEGGMGAHGGHAHGDHDGHGEQGALKSTTPAHAKPEKKGGPDVMFHTTFPVAGLYKAWGQFMHKGKIISASFVVRVSGTGGGAHGGDDHAHKAPHGGVVKSTGDGHIELKVEGDGKVTLWFLDVDEKPKSAKGASATLRPIAAGAKEITLVYDDKADALVGKLESAAPAEALVTITQSGKTSEPLRFALGSEKAGSSAASADKHPHH